MAVRDIKIDDLVRAQQLIEKLTEQAADAYEAMTPKQKGYYEILDKADFAAHTSSFCMSPETEEAEELRADLATNDEYLLVSCEEFQNYYNSLVDELTDAVIDAEAAMQVQQCMSDADIDAELEIN